MQSAYLLYGMLFTVLILVEQKLDIKNWNLDNRLCLLKHSEYIFNYTYRDYLESNGK